MLHASYIAVDQQKLIAKWNSQMADWYIQIQIVHLSKCTYKQADAEPNQIK